MSRHGHEPYIELLLRLAPYSTVVIPCAISSSQLRECVGKIELDPEPLMQMLSGQKPGQRDKILKARRDLANRIAEILVHYMSENDVVRGYTREQAPELFNVQDSQGPTFSTADTVRLDRGNPSDVG